MFQFQKWGLIMKIQAIRESKLTQTKHVSGTWGNHSDDVRTGQLNLKPWQCLDLNAIMYPTRVSLSQIRRVSNCNEHDSPKTNLRVRNGKRHHTTAIDYYFFQGQHRVWVNLPILHIHTTGYDRLGTHKPLTQLNSTTSQYHCKKQSPKPPTSL